MSEGLTKVSEGLTKKALLQACIRDLLACRHLASSCRLLEGRQGTGIGKEGATHAEKVGSVYLV